MTAWGASSLVQIVSTIQSSQTADFQAGVKQADSVGISAHFILPFCSLVTVAVSRAIFGVPSLHPKIPFQGAGLRQSPVVWQTGNLTVLATESVIRAVPRLLRDQSERLELPAPFSRRIAQPFDPNTARQPTFDRCSNEVRCEKS
jgi:hypothetical protein